MGLDNIPSSSTTGQGRSAAGRIGSEIRAWSGDSAAAIGHAERALVAAVEKGGQDRVIRLLRRGEVPEEQCWLKGAGLVPGLRLIPT